MNHELIIFLNLVTNPIFKTLVKDESGPRNMETRVSKYNRNKQTNEYQVGRVIMETLIN